MGVGQGNRAGKGVGRGVEGGVWNPGMLLSQCIGSDGRGGGFASCICEVAVV